MTTPSAPGSDRSDPPRARPFLERSAAAGRAAPTAGAGGGADQLVRAYTLTGGRTRTGNSAAFETLRFESMVSLTPRGHERLRTLTFERHKIAARCEHPLSIAELSAELRLPIGVARVLVGDLLDDGLLQRFDTPNDVMTDISLVRELIDGIRNL